MATATTPDRPDKKQNILLVADDFAISGGVSDAILELAAGGRISGASAIVTTPHWTPRARDLRALSGSVACGLHLNLTLGAPLAPMPGLAPGGVFPGISQIASAALTNHLDIREIEAEILRQIGAFEAAFGAPPDMIDGHQHVHALPSVRDALLRALVTRFPDPSLRPLVRNPADRLVRILRRKRAAAKAAVIAWLSRGFGAAVRAAAFPTNDSFAGISDFALGTAAADFERSLLARGALHMVMCHPGYPDAELSAIDTVTARRQEELDVLNRRDTLIPDLWRPDRDNASTPIGWSALTTSTR